LAGKGLVQAFEKWVPRVIGCSRSGIERVYYEQTGRELSDYILLQQADKTVRYNQLPPEAEIVRAAVRIPGAICYEQPSEFTRMRQQTEELLVPRQLGLDKLDPNVLLSTVEVANLTGFRPKTIRRWVSRKFLNYIRVGNRIRFRRSAVELFLAQREVRK
jgi:excisionase family DNA binding protein